MGVFCFKPHFAVANKGNGRQICWGFPLPVLAVLQMSQRKIINCIELYCWDKCTRKPLAGRVWVWSVISAPGINPRLWVSPLLGHGWRWSPSSQGSQLPRGSPRLARGRQAFAAHCMSLSCNTGTVSSKSNHILPIHEQEQLIALFLFWMELGRLEHFGVFAVTAFVPREMCLWEIKALQSPTPLPALLR